MQIPPNHQNVIDHLVASYRADERVVAAFLGGSYANGTADAYSDLDLYLITTDAAYADFCASRAAIVRLLGDPVFIEDFGRPNLVLYVFADGTEGELQLGREGELTGVQSGPYRVLFDKKNILAGAVFPRHDALPAEQVENLRRQINWFWHGLSHLITALGRNQLWWAHGQLETLRHYCVRLARLRSDFSDPDAGDEPYFKVEKALGPEQLAPLNATFCPLESEAILRSAFAIVRYYQALAPHLAQMHGVPYPKELERVMLARLEKLANRPPG